MFCYCDNCLSSRRHLYLSDCETPKTLKQMKLGVTQEWEGWEIEDDTPPQVEEYWGDGDNDGDRPGNLVALQLRVDKKKRP